MRLNLYKNWNLTQNNCRLQKLNLIDSNVIICFFVTPFLTPSSKPLLTSPLKLQNFTTPKMDH